MIPEKRTQTGVGATACASASQKWNGTTAALTSSPPIRSANAATTSPSARCPESACPIWARLSAPVRAYSSPVPKRMQKEPTLFVTAKLIAPSSGLASSTR